MKSRVVYEDLRVEECPMQVSQNGERIICRIKREAVEEGISYVDVCYDFFRAKVGGDGYFLTDAQTSGTVRTDFKERDDGEIAYRFSFVGCLGWNRGERGIFGIVTGMRETFGCVLGLSNGSYYLYPRFYLEGNRPDEDIVIEYTLLSKGGYVEMAKQYRQYQLTRGGCVPLKARIEADPRLRKSLDGIAVRIRQGWKPAPSPVEDQTPDTEPPMHTACTFDRVGDISDAFRKAGIENAEFCLVGWNIGGHDGRFPQIFPVEERLGGEKKLIKAIQKVKDNGYTIVAHDNATDAYHIADCFDPAYLLKHRDGSFEKQSRRWSGGRPYKICPRCQYELFEETHQQRLAELGFEGIHYIDVMTILPLLNCYDRNHPLTKKESAAYYRKIMKTARNRFGGYSSESGFDYAASDMDFILYTSFDIGKETTNPFYDALVPFWEIVYHGIIAYNPCTYTLNYMAKGIRNRLKYFELGGRPLVCYYANFADAGIKNWMGTEDFLCDTDEQLTESAEKIRQMADDYLALAPERYEFIENHERLSEDVVRTTYSNGTTVTVDYKNLTYRIDRSETN